MDKSIMVHGSPIIELLLSSLYSCHVCVYTYVHVILHVQHARTKIHSFFLSFIHVCGCVCVCACVCVCTGTHILDGNNRKQGAKGK